MYSWIEWNLIVLTRILGGGGGEVTEHSSWFQLHVHGELTSQKILKFKILNMDIGLDWLNQNTDFLIRSYFQSAAYKLIIIELQFKFWLSEVCYDLKYKYKIHVPYCFNHFFFFLGIYYQIHVQTCNSTCICAIIIPNCTVKKTKKQKNKAPPPPQ